MPLAIPPTVLHHALESAVCAAGHVPTHLLIADMREPDTAARFWALDLSDPGNPQLVLQTYVAHGIGSDPEQTGYATQFSNRLGSDETSLGLYAVGEGYTGEHGWSYRLIGLDPTNNLAFERDIMLHPARYVTPHHVGYSDGCAAVPVDVIPKLDRAWGTISGAYLYIDGPGAPVRQCSAWTDSR